MPKHTARERVGFTILINCGRASYSKPLQPFIRQTPRQHSLLPVTRRMGGVWVLRYPSSARTDGGYRNVFTKSGAPPIQPTQNPPQPAEIGHNVRLNTTKQSVLDQMDSYREYSKTVAAQRHCELHHLIAARVPHAQKSLAGLARLTN